MASFAAAHDFDTLHPIDVVEDIARAYEWDFDRANADQIAMEVEGQWRSYALTLAWNEADEALRLLVSFSMNPPEGRLPALYETLNRANAELWNGGFCFLPEEGRMIWRSALQLAGVMGPTPEQIDAMIGDAITESERLYPAFQLAVWGEGSARAALKVAMAPAYGHA